ncbi:MAG: transglutaminase domain-containing protein [Candidatus Micrarchaeota archaeon]
MKRRKRVIKPLDIITPSPVSLDLSKAPPLAETIWFPMTAQTAHGMKLVGLTCVTERLDLSSSGLKIERLHPAQPTREFLLTRKKGTVLGKKFHRMGNPIKVSRLAELVQWGDDGIIIPTPYIGDNWILKKDLITSLDVWELAIRLANSVGYTNDQLLYIERFTSERALAGLELGEGNCYDLSTLLVAILRMNSIHAQVVGYVDDDPNSTKNHWWIRAFVENQWKEFDACLNLNSIYRQRPATEIAEFLMAQTDLSGTFAGDKKQRYGIEGIEAAEFELPTTSTAEN